MLFTGKKAIVTGGSRSIGRAIACRLAKEGAHVLITYQNNQKEAEETIRMIEAKCGSASCHQADFSTVEGVEVFAQKAIAELERVDILVNNAAMISREGFEVSAHDLLNTFQVNTFAPFMLSQKIGTHMIEKEVQGAILFISSIAVDLKRPSVLTYGSSKAALNKLMEYSAVHLANYGIRVNALSPGFVDAGMNAERLAKMPKLRDHYHQIIPLGRMGVPNDIASVASFLVSDEASWLTGKVIDVDGGYATRGSYIDQ